MKDLHSAAFTRYVDSILASFADPCLFQPCNDDVTIHEGSNQVWNEGPITGELQLIQLQLERQEIKYQSFFELVDVHITPILEQVRKSIPPVIVSAPGHDGRQLSESSALLTRLVQDLRKVLEIMGVEPTVSGDVDAE